MDVAQMSFADNLFRVSSALAAPGSTVIGIQTLIDHEIVELFLRALIGSPPLDRHASPQKLLTIDCREIHDHRHLFDRILNAFSRWHLSYSDEASGVRTWDGENSQTMESGARSSNGHQDAHDTLLLRKQGALGDRINTSFPIFAQSLQTIVEKAAGDSHILLLLHADRVATLDGPIMAKDSSILSDLLRAIPSICGRFATIYVAENQSTFDSLDTFDAWPTTRTQLPSLQPNDIRCLIHHHLAQTRLLEESWESSAPTTGRSGVSLLQEKRHSLVHLLFEQILQTINRLMVPQDVLRTVIALLDSLWDVWAAPIIRGVVQASHMGHLAASLRSPLNARIERLYVLPMFEHSNSAAPSTPLPLAGRVALLATYLASWNPSRSDLRIFGLYSTANGKSRAKRRRQRRVEDQTLQGPRAAGLLRIEAIWECLCHQLARRESTKHPGARAPCASADGFRPGEHDFYAQMSYLECARLVVRSGPEKLDNVKFKSVMEREEARRVAGQMGLRLDDWQATIL